MNKGRATVLRVVRLNLEAGHRITRILQVLAIPRSTYYDYLKWKPSKWGTWNIETKMHGSEK